MVYTNVSAGRTWPSTSGNNTAFVVEAVELRGEVIEIWIARDGDGPSCLLSPTAAREVAAELLARADFIDPRGAERPPTSSTVNGNVTGNLVQCESVGEVRFG